MTPIQGYPVRMTKMTKTGRNAPCSCGSGKKFKKCCEERPSVSVSVPTPSPGLSPGAGVSGVTGLREVPQMVLEGIGVDELFEFLASEPTVGPIARRIREQKMAGTRQRPSDTLILDGTAPDSDYRAALLDKIAELVDENQTGRSDMCMPFAFLLARAMNAMGEEARALKGRVRYVLSDATVFSWAHAWVVTRDSVIDGNIDSVRENPTVPPAMQHTPPAPYWGPRPGPADRRFPSNAAPYTGGDGNDADMEMWWADLYEWLAASALISSR
jgi:hypothetical protein